MRLSFWHLLSVMLLVVLLTWGPPAVADQPVLPDQGQVTLPLETFLELTRKPKPSSTGSTGSTVPIPFLFSRGHYRIEARPSWAQVQGTLDLQVYQPGWVEIPLLPADVVLEEARLDGSSLTLYRKDGKFFMPVDRPGSYKLQATWNLPVQLSGATRSVVLKTPVSSVSGFLLVVPDRDLEVKTSPALPLTRQDEKTRTLARGAIPGGGAGEVRFSWTPRRADPALRGKANREKARLSTRMYDLVTVSETEVHCQVRLDMEILRNEVDRLTLRLPVGVEIEEVACANLAGWSESIQAGHKDLLIRLAAPVSGNHTLNLVLVQPLEKADSTWKLPALEVVGAETVKGSIGLGATGGLEIQPGKLEGVRAIDVSELPSEIRDLASFALLRAYEFQRQPWSVQLTSRKGQEVPVLSAAVDEASGLTLVTRDGKLVTSWTWKIRNNLKQSLNIRLPEGATLLTTTLDGHPTRPVQGAEGEIRLPLVASGQEGKTTFPVELTYVQEPGVSAWLSRQRLQAPQVDMPCSVLNWTLYLPLDEWIWHVGSNMRPGLIHEPEGGGIRSSSAGGPMAPSAGLARSKALRHEVSKDEVLHSGQVSDMVQQASRGTLPVKLNIPARGQSLQFSRLVVTDQEVPEIFLHYASPLLKILGGLLVLGLTLGQGWPQMRRERGLEPLLAAIVGLWVIRGWASGVLLELVLLWASRGLYLLVACWLYRNRSWLLSRLRGQGGEA
jgi:hypothetical protein